MVASYLPNLFTDPPATLINFLSNSIPALEITSAKLILFTDPNNLSPAPTLEAIFNSSPLISSATLLASLINFASL